MPSLKACLFDLDGVIVDTAQYHYIAWRETAQSLGFDLTHAQNELLKGISRMESLDIILAIGNVELDLETKVQLATVKNFRYLDLCQQMTPDDVLPGVREFMDSLRSAGIKMGLGSASKNAETILKRIEMLDYLEIIVDGNRITKGKPDPEIFLMGAEDLDVLPEECVVFEDAVAGVQAAKAGGMKAIGVGDPTILTEADFVISTFKSLDFKVILQLFFAA